MGQAGERGEGEGTAGRFQGIGTGLTVGEVPGLGLVIVGREIGVGDGPGGGNGARIIHVTDCYLPRTGGIETQVRALAERQHRLGHHATVATLTAAGIDEAVPSTPGQVVRLAHSTARAGSISYRSFPAGPRWLREQGADVVHIHASSFSPLSFATAQTASRLGIPTVVTVHSLWNRSTPLFAIADRLTGWADWPVAWSAVSQIAAVSLRRILSDAIPVTVLANGVDPAVWVPAQPSADKRSLRIVTVGRLARRKRIGPLARILDASGRRPISGRPVGDS